jgi:hypothetical protein
MMPFRYQLLGHLCAGLLVGFLLSMVFKPPEKEINQKTTPFITQKNMLAVSMVLHRDSRPEIVSIQPLSEGRLSIVQPGNYNIILQDNSGKQLFKLPFHVLFLQPGDPPQPTDTVRMILVIPNSGTVQKVILSGPQGSAEFVINE